MAATIELKIITPEKILLGEPVEMLVAPAIDGEIGVLPRHYPLVTGLKVGVLRIKKEGNEEWQPVAISDEGLMEVLPDRITILVGAAELPHEIDVERALAAKERAEKRISAREERTNIARAEAALQRALNRLRTANHQI